MRHRLLWYLTSLLKHNFGEPTTCLCQWVSWYHPWGEHFTQDHMKQAGLRAEDLGPALLNPRGLGQNPRCKHKVVKLTWLIKKKTEDNTPRKVSRCHENKQLNFGKYLIVYKTCIKCTKLETSITLPNAENFIALIPMHPTYRRTEGCLTPPHDCLCAPHLGQELSFALYFLTVYSFSPDNQPGEMHL